MDETQLRPATASEPSSNAQTKKGRTTSFEKWSNDGSSNFEVVADYDDDYDGYQKRAKSPLSGNTWATRIQKKKGMNPFVECMDYEQRLNMERQWLLEEDGVYMDEKKKDLKHYTVQNHIDLDIAEGDDLYEKNVFFGHYSMGMHEKKLGQKIRSRPEKGDLSRSKSSSGGKRNTTSKKGEHVKEKNNPSIAIQIKSLHKELETSAHSAVRVFKDPEVAPKKAPVVTDGFKDMFRRTLTTKIPGD